MSTTAFLTTFGLVFVAELGDKTQLAAMALAARHPWHQVLAGVAAAFVVLNVAAVAVGQVLFLYVPLQWIQLASAALFLFFGISTLLSRGDDDARVGAGSTSPILTSFVLILVAELGDKTQLATASLAAQHAAPVAVFGGSTLALWLVSLLGIFAGARLTRYVPLVWVHRAAGALFLAFAGAALHQALG